MKVLVLDDHRRPQFEEQLALVGLKDVSYVKTAKECIETLSNSQFDLIFLDYDLTYMQIEDPADANNGMAVARWLSRHLMNPNHKAQIVIHSVDPFGARHMKEHLPAATIMPGAWMKDRFKELLEKLNSKPSD